ncbi:site-specific integrase [Okeania sp. SIO1I7]|uniref:tyrosine-type recombinase/integrase n=1 Tax=Okeania sp. SIO1I7 TaxID=2607772 RepID=UPI0013F71101|nr:site-specific integrase [Okeania sp. SIO1I7]NET30010.1 site-specific integrase [Okeania sp. SIO1I7]
MKRSRKGKASIIESWEAQAIYENFTTPANKLIWQICRYTGERIGAVLQLKIENVYFNPARLVPLPEITFPSESRKKSPGGIASTRQVPIIKPLLIELQKFHLAAQSGWLFPSRANPLKHLSRQVFDKNFRVAVKKAGLSHRGISLHSLRRTLITRLHKAGYSIAIIQEITGHKSINALRQYIDIEPEAIDKAINSVDL